MATRRENSWILALLAVGLVPLWLASCVPADSIGDGNRRKLRDRGDLPEPRVTTARRAPPARRGTTGAGGSDPGPGTGGSGPGPGTGGTRAGYWYGRIGPGSLVLGERAGRQRTGRQYRGRRRQRTGRQRTRRQHGRTRWYDGPGWPRRYDGHGGTRWHDGHCRHDRHRRHPGWRLPGWNHGGVWMRTVSDDGLHGLLDVRQRRDGLRAANGHAHVAGHRRVRRPGRPELDARQRWRLAGVRQRGEPVRQADRHLDADLHLRAKRRHGGRGADDDQERARAQHADDEDLDHRPADSTTRGTRVRSPAPAAPS